MDNIKLTTIDNKKVITVTKENIEYLFKLVLEDVSIGNLTLNHCITQVWIYLRSWIKKTFDYDIYRGYTPSSADFSDWFETTAVKLYKKELDKCIAEYLE